MDTGTIGPFVHHGIGSSLGFHSFRSGPAKTLIGSEPTQMTNDLVARAWRLAVTIGPLVAIALSLAAGYKWR